MRIKVVLDEWGKMPTRAHDTDAGLDIYSPVDIDLEPHKSCLIDTGVHIEIPRKYEGRLESKSGLMTSDKVITTGGVIDCEYTGSIVAMLYNMSNITYHISKGQKITQLVIHRIITPKPYLGVKLKSTARGSQGFGSTGMR
jgi:deoxyuridine 5'-triphosphate nucleotidohydrolase